MRIRNMIYVVLVVSLMLGWTKVASAGMELLTNKQVYKKGEPIFLQAVLSNDAVNTIKYSIPNGRKTTFKLLQVNPGNPVANPVLGVNGFTPFEVIYYGLTYLVKYISFDTVTKGINEGTIGSFSKKGLAASEIGNSFPFNILSGQGSFFGKISLVDYSQITTVVDQGQIIKISTPGTYRIDYVLDGISFNAQPSSILQASTLITVE